MKNESLSKLERKNNCQKIKNIARNFCKALLSKSNQFNCMIVYACCMHSFVSNMINHRTSTLVESCNEGLTTNVVWQLIGTVKTQELCINSNVGEFEIIWCLFAHPSKQRKITTSEGYKYYASDRWLLLSWINLFFIAEVLGTILIILKKIRCDYITDRPLIAHTKINGPHLLAQFE